ncbi:MAG: hypothetical protein ACOYUZ_04560 [Patescibacteria group bacterium]
MSLAKKQVLGHITELVCRYVPADAAIVGTLGGIGLEAGVWRKAGIKPENSYFIDRDPLRMKALMEKCEGAVQILGSLDQFANVFCACRSAERGLDFFHLDLCGTINGLEEEISQILPLIFRSQARCFAVTVADARRNLAHETPKELFLAAAKLWPALHWQTWLLLCDLHNQARLECLQEADTEKVALRELSLLVVLGRALQKSSCPDYMSGFVCSNVLRFVYSSDGFRMRTYFFHFEPQEKGKQPLTSLAIELSSSVCTWFDQYGTQAGQIKPQTSRMRISMERNEEIKQIKSRLGPIMAMMNEDILREVERLFELASGHDDSASKLDMSKLDEVIAILRSLKGGAPVQSNSLSPSPASDPSAQESGPPPPPAKKRGRPKKVRPEGEKITSLSHVSLQDKDSARIALMEAARIGAAAEDRDASLNAAIDEWAEKFGVADAPNRFDMFSGLRARARGGFEPEFFARVLLAEPEGRKRNSLVAKLAKLYGYTKEQVLASAAKHHSWPQE